VKNQNPLKRKHQTAKRLKPIRFKGVAAIYPKELKFCVKI